MNNEYKLEFTKFVKGLTTEKLDELVEILYPRHKHETTTYLILIKRQSKYIIVEL